MLSYVRYFFIYWWSRNFYYHSYCGNGFGADKIPEIARGLGKGIRQVKDATNDIKKEINDSAKGQGLDTDLTKDIKKEISDVKESLDKMTGPIKRSL